MVSQGTEAEQLNNTERNPNFPDHFKKNGLPGAVVNVRTLEE